MSGPTTTTHDSLVDIWNVKIGRTDAYAAGNASDAGLEQKILKAVLGEGATATSIADFQTLAYTLATDSGTHKTAIISGSDLQVTQHFTHRNAVVVADYLQNEDTTGNATSSGAVAIKVGTTQSAPSKILNDSSAFENATVKFTVTDPYDVVGSSGNFSSTNGGFTGHFAQADDNYRYTRNVNANCANTAGSASISVTEHTAWNTADYGVARSGPAFVNGSLTLNGEGAPVATLYAANNVNNILSTEYIGTSGFGFDISYNSAGGQPVVGRYALNWVAGDGDGSSMPIEITSISMSSDLVVVGDKTEYEAFLLDTTTSVALASLPQQNDLYSDTLDPYLSENFTTQLPGFRFEISSESEVTGEVLITTTDDIVSPIAIDASEMDFALKNKYYLENSVDEDEHTLMLSTTVVGVPVTNSLTITNGSLALTGTDAALFQLLDGTESLGVYDYNTGGSIVIFNSAPKSAYNTVESENPRAVGGDANFAPECVVNYSVEEDDYIADVGVLAEDDKIVDDLSYNITALVAQTSQLGPTVNNKIGYLNGAVALVSQTNASITPSAISFSANTSSYDDGEVQVIDLVCQRKWQEGTAYKTDNTEIAGVAVNIIGSNVNDVAGLKDLRVKLDAKSLGELSFPAVFDSAGWAITVNDGSAFLKTSLLKQGVLDDSAIIDILTVVEPELNLTVEFGPAINSVNANKYTKFHNQLTVEYNGDQQITYNDEFTLSNYSVSAETVQDVTAAHNYVPANTKLTMRSFTETFKVTTPFRFGNYSNISITTPTITQTTVYYALTDNINADKVLPRSYLAPIRTIDGNLLPQATITDDMTTVTLAFTQADLKPFKSQLQQQVGGSDTWVDASGGDAHVDLWYNTNTYLESNVGDFEYAFSFSPAVNTMAEQTFYIDMSLEKGAASFSITGKTFTSAQVDALGEFDIETFDLATAPGTAITGMTASYTPDDSIPSASGTTTLSGGGYTFTYSNNMYVNIRIVACPHGLFKVVRNADAPTYKSIADFGEVTHYVQLGDGIYVTGGLKAANHGDNTTWVLLGDAIRINFWLGQEVTDYTRITALNSEYRYDEGWRGVENLIVRGFTPNSTVTIDRTPSSFIFNIAGYTLSTQLHSNINYQGSLIGNLGLSAVEGAITMYPTAFGEVPKVFPLSINYGSYTITDISGDGATPVVSVVPAYVTVISNRKTVRIISKSLNTLVSSYSLFYTTTNTLSVHRNPDYTSDSTDLNDDFTQVGTISLTALQTLSSSNYIGNVLNIHYLGESALPDLTCFFTIAPAFLKFQAVDHTTITASSLPFVKVDETHLLTRYSAVDHSASGSQSWTPFSGSNVNNMTISGVARTYENYRSASLSTIVKFNVGPNKLKIEYASGIGISEIGDYSTVFDTEFIPLNSGLDTTKVKFVSNFAATGKLEISLNQPEISNSSMPVVFDASDKFNLLVELGSHLLTPKEIILEFNAGDCTGLTTYCIDSMNQNGANLDVTIARYSNGSGINSDLFKNNVSNGIAVGGSTKETKTFSTPLTGNMADMLATIKTTVIPASTDGWATIDDGSNSDNVLWLKPTSAAGKTALRTALLLNTNIPRSITVFELDDALRIMDNQGMAVYRIASQGIQYRNYLGDYENNNLGTLVHAHLLR